MNMSELLHRRLRPPGAGRAETAAQAAMAALRDDPRLRKIAWRDLLTLSPLHKIQELALPLPWLAAELVLAHHGYYIAALLCSVAVFKLSFRLAHETLHGNLKVGQGSTDLVLLATSLVLLGSSHAMRWTHLRHHRLGSGPGGVEGIPAHGPAWRAIAIGPLFPLLLNLYPFQHANAPTRRWIGVEWSGSALWIAAAFLAINSLLGSAACRFHIGAMILGQAVAGFACIWTVHRRATDIAYPARTARSRFLQLASGNLILHVEHHLFPQVPARRLHILAERLDEAAPELRQAQVIGGRS